MKKLTLVSVIVRGVRYSGFFWLQNNQISFEDLKKLHPWIPKGTTISIG